MARAALLVTFDEQVDPQLARTALEDPLRNGALRWVGLDCDQSAAGRDPRRGPLGTGHSLALAVIAMVFSFLVF